MTIEKLYDEGEKISLFEIKPRTEMEGVVLRAVQIYKRLLNRACGVKITDDELKAYEWYEKCDKASAEYRRAVDDLLKDYGDRLGDEDVQYF